MVVALPSAFEGGALSVRAPSGTTPTLISLAGGRAATAAAAAAASGDGGAAAAAAAASGGGSSAAIAANTSIAAAAAGGAGDGSAAVVAEEEEVAVCTFNRAPAGAGTDELQWAAFFGDCVHEVEPVTAGHRVTITYAIVVNKGATDNDSKAVPRYHYFDAPSVMVPAPSVSAPHVARMVDHAAACPAANFGILLTHKYTFTGIASATLKGMYRVVCDGLVHAGLRVTLRPVVYSTGGYDDVDNYGNVANIVYSFGTVDVARLRSAAPAKHDAPPAGISFVRCSAAKYGRLRADEPVGVRLRFTYTAKCEFTGNEAQAENVYFAAAMIVSK